MEQSIFSEAKLKMDKAIEHYKKELSTIRTGRASSSILDIIRDLRWICESSFTTFHRHVGMAVFFIWVFK